MERLAKVLLLAFAITGVCRAQYSEQYGRCMDKAGTQTAMHMCAGEEARRTDAELNNVYQKLLLAASNQPSGVEKIKVAERAWISYRDAYINAMYPAEDKIAAYGSIFPTEADLLRIRLTQQQILALKELLKQYGDSKP
ncbi:MAG TPA: lysozyme inhibitor LprI family protein [Bryobacteraceae bacterium]|nr:lysozyme inhibitor LprI family protein [Bryobacteraceae bacterium]